MALAADYASASRPQQRSPSPWVAAFLTLLAPGLGHLYLGQAKRGILLFALVMVADTLLMFAMMGVLARFWMFAVSGLLLLGLWLYIRPSRTVVGQFTRGRSCWRVSCFRGRASMRYRPRHQDGCFG
jgi:TM2 domain-containing membrane protein YozV